MEQADSKFFSQRAKNISLLNEQPSSTVTVKSEPSVETHFQFSNRTHISTQSMPPVGRGHGNIITNNCQHNISVGRGRTTVPLSSFVLQKDDPSSSSSSSNGKPRSSPIFVMHDEVQFVRPYFGPRNSNDMQASSLSRKREVLLSALQEIESGLKTL